MLQGGKSSLKLQNDNPQQFNTGDCILATLNKIFKKTQGDE